MRAAHGIVVLDKPAGVSSAKALAPLKRLGKVGHAGTLDPFATGVLLALVGDATRLSSLAMALPKTYLARVEFGFETDTLDPEGSVVAEADPGAAPPPGLEAALSSLTGEIEQVPPVFSAKKVEGRRAYELARAGRAPELEPRLVRVHSIEPAGDRRGLAADWPAVELRIVCGTGTYVRSIARDLGRALGLPATLVALRRTAVGPFAVEQADPDRCLAPLELIAAVRMRRVELDLAKAKLFVGGRAVLSGARAEAADGERCAVVFAGGLIGLGECRGGRVEPDCVLANARREIETQKL